MLSISHVTGAPLRSLRGWKIVVVPRHMVQVRSDLASGHLLPKHIRTSEVPARHRSPRASKNGTTKARLPRQSRKAHHVADAAGLKYRATRSSGGGKSRRAYGEPHTRRAELRNSPCKAPQPGRSVPLWRSSSSSTSDQRLKPHTRSQTQAVAPRSPGHMQPIRRNQSRHRRCRDPAPPRLQRRQSQVKL